VLGREDLIHICMSVNLGGGDLAHVVGSVLESDGELVHLVISGGGESSLNHLCVRVKDSGHGNASSLHGVFVHFF